MPSGSKDSKETPSKAAARAAKGEGERAQHTTGSGKQPTSPAHPNSNSSSSGGGEERKPARHSVQPSGPRPKQKPKPALNPEPTAMPATVTLSRSKGSGDQEGPGAAPTQCLVSPKMAPAPPPVVAKKVGAKGSAAAAAEEAGPPMALQRSASARHGTLVRVVDYGVTAEQGIRPTMEDQHTMLAEGIPFFGVYDGHGGTQCAEYLRDHLHTMILSHPDIRTDPEKAITDCFVQADRDFLALNEEESSEAGSVCAVAMILDDNLVVGNVGDCEAVLCRNSAPLVLTTKHNLQSNPGEVERVKEAGGRTYHDRVGHPKYNPQFFNLAVTRAIGDAGFKLDEFTDGRCSGVIAVPATTTVRLTPEDEFLIIGCDGLWDVMSYGQVVDFCERRLRSGEVAQHITDDLAQAALNAGGRDNVTAMLIHLTRTDGGAEVYRETAVSTSTRNLSEEA